MSLYEIDALESGECRWVGRRDVQVYCRRPSGAEPTYCVVCPEAGLEYGTWLHLEQAAEIVDSLVAGSVPAKA
jgi:hypothetical protein